MALLFLAVFVRSQIRHATALHKQPLFEARNHLINGISLNFTDWSLVLDN